MDDEQELRIRVSNSLGLHARPAGKIAQEAQRFMSSVVLSTSDGEADAKSILDVLTLAAPLGTEVRIRAHGPDATQAVQALAQLFADKFGEDK